MAAAPDRAADEAPQPAADAPPLREAFADRFLVGTCVGTGVTTGSEPRQDAARRTIARHFNAVTCENAMKWGNLQPRPGVFTFEQADAIVDFAERHGMKVFGHTFVWHNQTPAWATQDAEGRPLPRDVAIANLRAHMAAVLEHYRGRVTTWDVVNEAIADNLGGKTDADPLRDTPWRRAIGDDYVDVAFRLAHELAPQATLIYNDYGWHMPAKRRALVALLRGMLDRGVPVHAVGIQGHWGIHSPDLDAARAILRDAASLQLPIHVTELDLNVIPWSEKGDPYRDGLPDDVAALHARRYHEWFTAFAEFADRIDRVSFWGPNDGMSWLNNFPVRGRTNYPLLFDRDNRTKPAFDAVWRAARGE